MDFLTYKDGSWYCPCGTINPSYRKGCRICGKSRWYLLCDIEAKAVARKLNNLETENKRLSALLAASTLSAARFGRQRDDAIALFRAANRMALRLYQKMPCGHEQRFVVSRDEGTNWCALCEIEGLEEIARMWAASIRAHSKGGKP